MPAHRSRTTGWRSCLQQLLTRNGSLQIALAPSGDSSCDFIWCVKLIALSDDEIQIEIPTAAGVPLSLEEGVRLLGIIAIGQNRWMFKTTCLGVKKSISGDQQVCSLRLQMPTTVERCQRRRAFRISTDSLSLPNVTVWPLLNPRSVVLPEQLCQLRMKQYHCGTQSSETISEEVSMPEVGADFSAVMVNIGGGGLGLQVHADQVRGIARHRLFWVRFPQLHSDGPQLCLTAKLMHSHLEAGGAMYMGMKFDFSNNPSHRAFVIQQITHEVAIQQRKQLLAA